MTSVRALVSPRRAARSGVVHRLVAGVALLAALLAGGAAGGALAAPPDDGVADRNLVPVPPGCPVPDPAAVAFVGEVVDKDGFIEKGTVRFQIVQIRAGDASPYSAEGLIDVRFGPDSKYLDIGEQYFVAAAIDPSIGQLASRIEAEKPLFGGDAVIGIDDTAVECPVLDDPVQTLDVDGTQIETGLFEPMFEDRRLLLATIGVPAAIAGLALVALVLLRRLLDLGMAGVFRLGRAAVTPTRDVRASRVREHGEADPDRHREPLIGGGRVGSAFRRVGAATSGARTRVQTTVKAASDRLGGDNTRTGTGDASTSTDDPATDDPVNGSPDEREPVDASR